MVFCAWGAAPAVAQDTDGAAAARVYPVDPEAVPRPLGRITRTPGPIVLDGVPDEAAWAAAEPLSDFVQQEPNTGAAATYPTVVRLLYDDHNLYIAAVCYDPEPDRAITAGLEHDFSSGASDIFGVTLDTFLDRRNSFLFLVNPKGAVRDEQTFDDSRNVIAAWEAVVRVKTATSDSAWFVEMAIPFTTLRFDADRTPQDWGANFIRRIRRLNETSYWAPLERRHRVHRMSRAGTLTGLRDLRQGRNLTLMPYALTGRSTGAEVAPGDAGARTDAGLDMKWGVTPSMTLDVSVNTDFAQTEVDQEQVNLTRFSLFFPEQREFFIENAGSFTFGDQTERNYRMGASLSDLSLFHSRRIGLTDDGRPVPVLGGARLSGRAGAWMVGLLDMRTQATALAGPGENFFVGRVRRRFAGSSDAGGIVIDRLTPGGSRNTSYGADANLRFGELVVNSYVAGVRDDAGPTPTRDWAGRVSVAYRDRLWDTSAMVKRVGADFDPAVGFVRRRAMEQWYGTVGAHTRPRVNWLREAAPYVEANYITDLNGRLETRELRAGMGFDFLDGGGLDFTATDQHEFIDEAATIAGVVIPAGVYDFRSARVAYSASTSRKLSGSVGVSGGEFWSGTRRSIDATIAWRPHYAVFFQVLVNRNALNLDGTDVTANVTGLRLRYALSTRLFGSAFVQRNAVSDETVTSWRLDWRHAPLSDMFFVFTTRQGPAGLLERSAIVKITRTLSW